VQFDQEAPETLWLGKRAGSELLVRDPGTLSPDAARLSVLPAGHPQGYQDAFNAFVADTYAEIGGDSRAGLPTFRDGLRAAVLTESIIESSASGQWTDVPDVKELEGVQQ
jgi:predicted dehydrogenase